MAVQLKCDLHKWRLLFANALALLSDLNSHRSHSAWLCWMQTTPTAIKPLWAWFCHPIQSIQPLHTAVVISLWGYRTAVEEPYLEVIRGLSMVVTNSAPACTILSYWCTWRSTFMQGWNPCWRTRMKSLAENAHGNTAIGAFIPALPQVFYAWLIDNNHTTGSFHF